MNAENVSKFNRQAKRQSYSSTRSKPLEYIYHNPILKSTKKHEIHPGPSRDSKDLSVKILDLKLPVIAAPRILNKFLNSCHRVYRAQKAAARCRSIIPELYINANNSSFN